MATMILTEAPPVEERRGYAVLYEIPGLVRRVGLVVDNKNDSTIVILEAKHTSLADEPSAQHECIPITWVKAWIGPVKPPVKPPHIPYR